MRAPAWRTSTAIVGPEFDVGEVAKEVDTLGGYVATRIGRVPVRGELVPGPGRFEIEVLDADPRRVKKLKIYRSHGPADAAQPRRRARRPGDADSRPSATAVTRRRRRRTARHRDESVKLSPDAAPSKLRADRDAHPPRPLDRAGLGLAARADRIRWPAPSRRWRCRRSTSGRCRSSPFRSWSGWSTAPAAGRLGGVLAAATAGWWFGFGYFLAGLYWVGNAFLVDAKTFGWLLPFAVVGAAGRAGALHRVRRSRWRG